MSAHRVAALALFSLAGLAAAALPATAQVSDGAVLSIMRECARIDDPSARLACYDNNIRSTTGPRSTMPGQVRVEGGPGAAVRDATPAGFGREDVPDANRFARSNAGELEEITGTVATVEQRGFGLYAFTLEDGAQWLFAESVPNTYNPPRAGSRVELRRGSMDSYLMRFANQTSVRVRRVQ